MYVLRGVTKRYTRGKDTVNALDGVDLTIEDGGPARHPGPHRRRQVHPAADARRARPAHRAAASNSTDGSRRGCREAKLTKVRGENIGFVFQSFNLIPTLTAQENVETALVPLGVKAKERRERAAEALESVGLGERLGHLPAEMSGGQQQRVAIARALVKQPKVLLADEPTGNLDESMRDEIMEVLETLWKEHGLTFIMVTHDSIAREEGPAGRDDPQGADHGQGERRGVSGQVPAHG